MFHFKYLNINGKLMINVNLASKVRKGTLHWCVYIATPSSKLSKLPRDKNGGGGGVSCPSSNTCGCQ